MNIQVLFFASLKEHLGKAEIQVEISSSQTVAALWNRLTHLSMFSIKSQAKSLIVSFHQNKKHYITIVYNYETKRSAIKYIFLL